MQPVQNESEESLLEFEDEEDPAPGPPAASLQPAGPQPVSSSGYPVEPVPSYNNNAPSTSTNRIFGGQSYIQSGYYGGVGIMPYYQPVGYQAPYYSSYNVGTGFGTGFGTNSSQKSQYSNSCLCLSVTLAIFCCILCLLFPFILFAIAASMAPRSGHYRN